MTNKLMLLAVIFSLILTLGLVIACGDDDDDDDNDDNDAADDDDATELTCDDVYTMMYTDCGLAFKDEDNADIPLADIVFGCEEEVEFYALGGDAANCVIDNEGECEDMEACLAALLE